MASYGETLFLLETLLKYNILTAKAEKAGIKDLSSFLDDYDSCRVKSGNDYYYPANICVPSSHETVLIKIVSDNGHIVVPAYYDSGKDIWYRGREPASGRIVGWKPIGEPAVLLVT